MAQIADLSYDSLVWHTNWYLCEETLRPAINAIVDFQCRQSLSKVWGGVFSLLLMVKDFLYPSKILKLWLYRAILAMGKGSLFILGLLINFLNMGIR
jgi:hypothetical protein